MTFQSEFPDYAEADMPKMFPGFIDRSWKGDACPHFYNEKIGLIIFTDYADAQDREFPETKRFSVHTAGAAPEGEPLDVVFEAEQWSDVDQWVRERYPEIDSMSEVRA